MKTSFISLSRRGIHQKAAAELGERVGKLEDQVWTKAKKEGNQVTDPAGVMPQDSLDEALLLLPLHIQHCPGDPSSDLLHCHRGHGAPGQKEPLLPLEKILSCPRLFSHLTPNSKSLEEPTMCLMPLLRLLRAWKNDHLFSPGKLVKGGVLMPSKLTQWWEVSYNRNLLY